MFARSPKNYHINSKGIILELLTISLSAVAIAASIATAVTLRIKTQSTKLEGPEQEHTKRRAELRELAHSLTKAAITNDTQAITLLCSQLGLNLNPADSEDAALIQAAEALGETEEKSARLKEFTGRMALLLNYEKDKKTRASLPWFNRAPQPDRTKYTERLTSATTLEEVDKQKRRKRQAIYYFGMVAISAGMLFFFTAGFAEPFQELLRLFNDKNVEKTAEAWWQFGLTSISFGVVWSGVYLWFKGSEKRFLEVIFTK